MKVSKRDFTEQRLQHFITKILQIPPKISSWNELLEIVEIISNACNIVSIYSTSKQG